MSLLEEYKALRQKIDILERQVALILDKSGMTEEDSTEIQTTALIDHALQTGNYKPLQEYQRKKNTLAMK